MICTAWRAAGVAALLVMVTFARAADAPTDAMPLPLARALVDKTIALVESRGLYPRKQSDYALFKAALLADVDGHVQKVDRTVLYRDVNGLLATLDTGQRPHSFLIAPVLPVLPGPAPDIMAAPRAEPLDTSTFNLLDTGHGVVLRWVPPAVPGFMPAAYQAEYVKRIYEEPAARPEFAQACALVIDLSEQTGGNAWPPFIAMYPLFSDANTARWVDRDGKRTPFVNRTRLASMARPNAAGRPNPLARFATGPLAVVVGERTASAGEMLLVALLGEARVQTFGQTSFGQTTANGVHPLPDGSTLVLSELRYALDDGPVYRDGIPPMHPQPKGEPLAASVQAAAEWVAAHSPQCGTAGPVSPASPAPPTRMP
jgi:hypothetical protein